MSKKIIAEFCLLVILSTLSAAFFCACESRASRAPDVTLSQHYLPAEVLGTIKAKDIEESSGLAASRCQPDVLWTHNDSGDEAYLFAVSTGGKLLGTWRVAGAENVDWEDMAAFKDSSGRCFLYLGDTGDNKGKNPEHAVYRVREPVIDHAAAATTRKTAHPTNTAEVTRFLYPDRAQDAETLMVHPRSGDIYIVTKHEGGPAGIYVLRTPQFSGQVMRLERVADLSVPAIPNGLVTGGDISPDGRRAVICDYAQAYEWTLPNENANFDEIWKIPPEVLDVGKRKHGETVTYGLDGNSIFLTSEGRNSPVIRLQRRQ